MRTTGRMSENALSFKADASDNKARYTCEAKNVMISNTLKAEIDLTVLFAPSHVTISGPTEARVGDPVPLTCSTAPSNPAAEIKWVVLGKQHKEANNRTAISPEGGWVTTSNVTVMVEPKRTSVVVVCHGINGQLAENVVATHTINVLFAPSHVTISGPSEARVGDPVPLTCSTAPSNPAAEIKWVVLGKQHKEANNRTAISPEGKENEQSLGLDKLALILLECGVAG
ncbi:synaptogenesis protein syg-2-like [Manduca sexta]|uniref:synaptogenesis protein syg-2-like n=1 Tax=Manduca sexta TaxID=7130 RepID=UPI00188E197F|nr:synaptogenesis protein syg-2-like [Manduca sexta]